MKEPKKLFKATTVRMEQGKPTKTEKTIYIVANDMFQAADLLKQVTTAEEMLKDINLVSEECYV